MASSMRVPESQKKNLDWYVANQKSLSEKYDGKVLLIVDQQLVQTFDSMEEAYAAATAYPAGTFSLQPCSARPDSYTVMLHTPYLGVLNLSA